MHVFSITQILFCIKNVEISQNNCLLKAHTVSKCNIKSTKIKDILKHAEAISSKHKITKQH
jgi:hypothetical protein